MRVEEEKKQAAASPPKATEMAPAQPAAAPAAKPGVASLFGDPGGAKQTAQDLQATARVAQKAAPLVKKFGGDKPLF